MLSNAAVAPQEKHARLIIVDDEEAVLQALKRLFHRQYEVEVFTRGADALEYLKENGADLIISDMRMPSMTGAELLKQCFEQHPDMIRILLTGFSDLESAIKAVNEGNIYRYIAKPWDNDNLRAVVAEAIDMRDLRSANLRLNDRVAEQNSELERLNRELQAKFEQKSEQVGEAEERLREAYRTLRQEFNGMVHLLVSILENRIGEESGSSEKLARLAKLFAEFAGLQGEQVQDMYYAALLRNLGKVMLPDSVINKAIGQMSVAEKSQYARFPVHGQNALMMLEQLQNSASIIRGHMELYNGKGFPDRFAGNAITKESRMLRIVSDYADLQHEHNFLGESLNELQTREYLLKMAGQRYDRELVDIFLMALDDFEEGVVSSFERIELREVKPGQVLAANLVSPAGVVLLSEGTVLTERHVSKLKSMMSQFEGHDLRLHIRREDAAKSRG